MKPNVFVFILDTLRYDQLRGCGAAGQPANFLEQVLQQGTFFNRFFPAGGTTRVSVNALFNGFFGTTTGLNHQHCTDSFAKTDVLTLANIFRYHGWRTKALTQGDISLLPAGFDHLWTNQPRFEGEKLQDLLNLADGPVFAYLHFYGVHDAAFGRPGLMTPENYRRHLDELALEIQEVWEAVVQPGDVVVIASDHGCRLREKLDPAWRFYLEEEPVAGTFLAEDRIRGVCSIIGPGYFPPGRIEALVRGVDILPTLCDGLKLERPRVQGRSLWPALQGDEAWPESVAYAETGGIPLAHGKAANCCLRTDRWKLVRYTAWGEGLYDLDDDPEERNNLVGRGLAVEGELRRQLASQEMENSRGVEAFQPAAAELGRRIRSSRKPWPRPQAGERDFSLGEIIDGRVRSHLGEQIKRYGAGWPEEGERIVLFSASAHARAFLAEAGAPVLDCIVGIIDSDNGLAGEMVAGIEVFPVAGFMARLAPTMVLVAHHHYADDMYIRLKNECSEPVPVYNIYRLDRQVPLWWDRKVAGNSFPERDE